MAILLPFFRGLRSRINHNFTGPFSTVFRWLLFPQTQLNPHRFWSRWHISPRNKILLFLFINTNIFSALNTKALIGVSILSRSGMSPTLACIIQGFLWSWMAYAKGDPFSIYNNFPCLSPTPVIWCLNYSYTPLTTKVKTPWRVFSVLVTLGKIAFPIFLSCI